MLPLTLSFPNTLSIQARGPTGSNPCSQPKQLTCLKYFVGIQARMTGNIFLPCDAIQERYVGPHNKINSFDSDKRMP